ncbi:MAG: hypothetical protein HY667_00115 [Chloroflexi bacterium]|nr:hypothetical protein [Chloroflexota bacterium]
MLLCDAAFIDEVLPFPQWRLICGELLRAALQELA